MAGGRFGSFAFAFGLAFAGWAKANVPNVRWQGFNFLREGKVPLDN
jgi:hypothetical protein